MRVFTPDNTDNYHPTLSIFLAGTIDDGQAYNWQQDIIKKLKTYFFDKSLLVLNPRRDNWLSNASVEEQYKQIDWELNWIRESELVFFHFADNSRSPVTMQEFGYCIGAGKPTIISCSPNFYRYQNVKCMNQKFGKQLFNHHESLDKAFNALVNYIDNHV